MQSALFRTLFPPPSPGPNILARLNGPRARCATDTRVTSIMQSVVRYGVRSDVCPHIVNGPFEERIDFGQPVHIIPRFELKSLPVLRLFAAQARNPTLLSAQCVLQRFNLSHMAGMVGVGEP